MITVAMSGVLMWSGLPSPLFSKKEIKCIYFKRFINQARIADLEVRSTKWFPDKTNEN